MLLVGDYHYSDLKVIRPGAGHGYAEALQTARLTKPVYQVRPLMEFVETGWSGAGDVQSTGPAASMLPKRRGRGDASNERPVQQ